MADCVCGGVDGGGGGGGVSGVTGLGVNSLDIGDDINFFFFRLTP